MAEKQYNQLPYHRFNVPFKDGLGKIKLDEFKPEVLKKIEAITLTYCDTIQAELEEVAKILIAHRRARAGTPTWEMVSTGVQYMCPISTCSSGKTRRPSADNLRKHLIKRHQFLDEPQEEKEKLNREVKNGKHHY